ncbi:hypothetical protein QK908_11465 [Lactococcus cremoris]
MPLKAGDYFDFKLPDGVTIEEAMGNMGDYGTYLLMLWYSSLCI